MAGVDKFVQGFGTILSGQSANTSAQYAAGQMDYQAGQVQAASQRSAADQRRVATLANSRLQALAGGSGADPTVVRLASEIAGRGEYNALAAIYQGDNAASGLRAQAAGTRYSGEVAEQAAELQAFGQFANGASQMFGGFSLPSSTPVGNAPLLGSGAASRTILSAGIGDSLYNKYR